MKQYKELPQHLIPRISHPLPGDLCDVCQQGILQPYTTEDFEVNNDFTNGYTLTYIGLRSTECNNPCCDEGSFYDEESFWRSERCLIDLEREGLIKITRPSNLPAPSMCPVMERKCEFAGLRRTCLALVNHRNNQQKNGE